MNLPSHERAGVDTGRVTKRTVDPSDRLWRGCVHEAGHAVAAEAVGGFVVYARVRPDEVRWGVRSGPGTTHPPENLPPRSRVRALMAGSAAEMLFFNEFIMAPPEAGWQDVELAQSAMAEAGRPWHFDSALEDANSFLRPYKRAIEAVALELMSAGELSGDWVRELMALHPPERPKGNRRARRRKRRP